MQFKYASGLLHLQLFLLFIESVPLQLSSLGTSSPACHQKPLTLDASSLLSLPLHPALLETLCLGGTHNGAHSKGSLGDTSPSSDPLPDSAVAGMPWLTSCGCHAGNGLSYVHFLCVLCSATMRFILTTVPSCGLL